MRQIPQRTDEIKGKMQMLTGKPLRIKVHRGRNRVEYFRGQVENLYPQVFTVRNENGEMYTFSYADVVSKSVHFYRC